MATPRTWVVGEVVTAALMNQEIRDQITLLLNPPMAVLKQTVTQNVANGTWQTLTFDSEVIDSYNGHSTVTNTSRYTCQLAGWYRVTGRAAFAINGTGSRGARVHINAAFIQGGASLYGAGTLMGIPEATHVLQLAVGDYIEIAGGQNSGGTLATAFVNEGASMMYVDWIHA
ncbi:hypothetical protein [Streptomyces sp. NPDC001194]|uniref:hypothetical protein n=1 Tax=Streptomyces sp. NPDC001194 TaxID=3364547 RepID=UPI0036930319